jgi:hypothetical protein
MSGSADETSNGAQPNAAIRCALNARIGMFRVSRLLPLVAVAVGGRQRKFLFCQTKPFYPRCQPDCLSDLSCQRHAIGTLRKCPGRLRPWR